MARNIPVSSCRRLIPWDRYLFFQYNNHMQLWPIQKYNKDIIIRANKKLLPCLLRINKYSQWTTQGQFWSPFFCATHILTIQKQRTTRNNERQIIMVFFTNNTCMKYYNDNYSTQLFQTQFFFPRASGKTWGWKQLWGYIRRQNNHELNTTYA